VRFGRFRRRSGSAFANGRGGGRFGVAASVRSLRRDVVEFARASERFDDGALAFRRLDDASGANAGNAAANVDETASPLF
jgi:hypothetical protein